MSDSMTPSQQAKALGCESLAQVARVSGVNPRTLLNYHKHKPWLFAAVCEKVARDNEPDNMKAAKQIVETLCKSDTGIIELSVGGVLFTAQLDGYAISNDDFGKFVELHGFTIHFRDSVARGHTT